jgi:hypothetical protein
MWKTIPPENVSYQLETWRLDNNSGQPDVPPTCNTIACFGGWCAWWPAFRQQGVKSFFDGSPSFRVDLDNYDMPYKVSQVLFGDRRLFNPRGLFGNEKTKGLTDHEVVMKRLVALLKEAEKNSEHTTG